MRSLVLALALAGCSAALASPLTPHRSVQTVGSFGRFSFSAACEAGELTATRNPLHVPSGGAVVVHLTPCNASTGDRMAANVYHNPVLGTCVSTTDSQIGTNGDGGSDPGGTNFAVIAGSVPCLGSVLQITDVTSGAVSTDIPIIVP